MKANGFPAETTPNIRPLIEATAGTRAALAGMPSMRPLIEATAGTRAALAGMPSMRPLIEATAGTRTALASGLDPSTLTPPIVKRRGNDCDCAPVK